MKKSGFKQWLLTSTTYSNRVVNNIVCRLNRADRIHPIRPEEVYLFELGQIEEFNGLSVTVKSQIRKAVKLYIQYVKSGSVEEK